MKVAPVAVAIIALALVGRFAGERYDQADSKLSSFYGDMLRADISAAKIDIDSAIALWSWNPRYYSWRGYVVAQSLPSHCFHQSDGTGQALTRQDQQTIHEALADYRRALDLNKRDAVAHHNVAWLEHLTGNDEGAAIEWRNAILIDPLNSTYHLSYSMFLDETNHSEVAQNELEQAIELSPSIVDSLFFRQYRGQFPRSADSIVRRCTARIEAGLSQRSDAILEARLGKLYLFAGDTARAIDKLHRSVESLPNLPVAWLNLGDAYASRGDRRSAIDCFKKANVLNNSAPGPYLGMANIYLESGETRLAEQYLRRAAELTSRVTPVTAAHNNRLYVGPNQRIDDLLPPTLLNYVTSCATSEVFGKLYDAVPLKEHQADRLKQFDCDSIPSPHPFTRTN